MPLVLEELQARKTYSFGRLKTLKNLMEINTQMYFFLNLHAFET